MWRRCGPLFLRALFVLMLASLLGACDDDDDVVGPGMMDGVENGDFEGGPGMMDGAANGEFGGGPGMMDDDVAGGGPGMMGDAARGDFEFESNGERIYLTGTSARTGDIAHIGGPETGMGMMDEELACVTCHGVDARGGERMVHMEVIDAPNIRWEALAGHGAEAHEEEGGDHAAEEESADEGYDLETFRTAVVGGLHPNGEPLSEVMPRWRMEQEDLADLAEYLQSLEG